MAGPNKQKEAVSKLADLTDELEVQIPGIKGAFPNFSKIVENLELSAPKNTAHVLGTIKSGKSTLANALIGKDLLPRGSGVKTFNITRVAHGSEEKVQIEFKSDDQLSQQIQFDFRIIGLDCPVDIKWFTNEGLAKLKQLYRDHVENFEKENLVAKSIDRTANLVQLSHGRIEKVLQGIEEIHKKGAEQNDFVASKQMEFSGETLEDWVHWASSPALASLINSIELNLPFFNPGNSYELIDCQGSDSLNPLDRHAVNAALYSVDMILYVISSRVGLRQADVEILESLTLNKHAENVVFIQNVEAHEPLKKAELDTLGKELKKDLKFFGGDSVVVMQVCGYLELMRGEDSVEFKRVEDRWIEHGCGDTFEYVQKSFSELKEKLESDRVKYERPKSALAENARATAAALLKRDIEVLGVRGNVSSRHEVENAVKSIISGEKNRLEKKLFDLTHDLFNSGELPKAIKGALTEKPKEWIKKHGLPSELDDCQHHGPIIATALQEFNEGWLASEERIRTECLGPYLENAHEQILESIELLHRLLPTVIPEEVLNKYGGHLPKAEEMRHLFKGVSKSESSKLPLPVVLNPVSIKDSVISGLAAEFYARKYFGIIKQKVSKKSMSPEQIRVKAEKLWVRTIDRVYSQAKEDTTFSVSSARENFKFLFFRKLNEKVMEQFQELVLKMIESWYGDLATSEASGKLLLTGDQRRQLESYIEEVTPS